MGLRTNRRASCSGTATSSPQTSLVPDDEQAMEKQASLRHIGWVAICVFAWMPAFGQDSKDEIIQKLIFRVEALEREVRALKPAVAPEQTVATPSQEPVPTTAAAPARPLVPRPVNRHHPNP